MCDVLPVITRRRLLRDRVRNIPLGKFTAGDLAGLIRLIELSHGEYLDDPELEEFERRVEEILKTNS